jgi:dihydroneopterin aldolase
VTNIPAPGVDPPDRIELRGLRALGTHGVLPEERDRPQPFEIDVDLEVDLRRAGRSDNLADTIDYGAVAEAVAAAVAGPHVDLLEHLADRIAAAAWEAVRRQSLPPARQRGSLDRDRAGSAPDRAGGPPAGADQSRPAGLSVLPSPVPTVTGVTVSVRKLRPPVGVDMRSAGVRIHRYPDELAAWPGPDRGADRSIRR